MLECWVAFHVFILCLHSLFFMLLVSCFTVSFLLCEVSGEWANTFLNNQLKINIRWKAGSKNTYTFKSETISHISKEESAKVTSNISKQKNIQLFVCPLLLTCIKERNWNAFEFLHIASSTQQMVMNILQG